MKKTLVFPLVVLLVVLLPISAAYWLTSTPHTAEAQSSNCGLGASITVAASASQVIVAAVPGATVRVCSFTITADTIATIATFSSSGTNITGAMRMCDECSIPVGDGNGIVLEGIPGGTLTLTATTGAITGFVRYGQ